MPKTVEVYHCAELSSGVSVDPNAELVHVASVAVPDDLSEAAALEFAYRWTNNIEASWSRPGTADYSPAVTVRAPLPVIGGKTYGLRSTSMGDRLVIGGKNFRVAMFGFEPENADGTANLRNL